MTKPRPELAKARTAVMASAGDRQTRASAIRTPAAWATSWQNALELSIRAAAADGPNVGTPAARRASARPSARGCSGPMTASSTAFAPGDLDDRGMVGGRDLDALDPRQLTDRVAARRHDHEVDPGFVGQLPGQGVLAAATADDEDPGRHHGRAHAGAPVARPAPVRAGERRIGRQARSIVWVRSGPTETSTIGTPAWSSSAET